MRALKLTGFAVVGAAISAAMFASSAVAGENCFYSSKAELARADSTLPVISDALDANASPLEQVDPYLLAMQKKLKAKEKLLTPIYN